MARKKENSTDSLFFACVSNQKAGRKGGARDLGPDHPSAKSAGLLSLLVIIKNIYQIFLTSSIIKSKIFFGGLRLNGLEEPKSIHPEIAHGADQVKLERLPEPGLGNPFIYSGRCKG